MHDIPEQMPLVPPGETPILSPESILDELAEDPALPPSANINININTNTIDIKGPANVKSLLGLALGAVSISIHSLNPNCQHPSLSLAGGAAIDQINVPGLPFSASLSCPRLVDAEHLFVFVNGQEHHDLTLVPPSQHHGGSSHPSSQSASGSEIHFVYGLNKTSLISIIAADEDGYPFMSSFPLHFDDDDLGAIAGPADPFPPSGLGFGFGLGLDLDLEDPPLTMSEAPEQPPSDHTKGDTDPSALNPSSPSSTPYESPIASNSNSNSNSNASINASNLAACRAKNPDYPMLRPECQTPALKTCDFYSSCIESSLPCGLHNPSSYALPYGLKFCRKFEHNLGLFSPRGNDFVWGTMNCLQRALVPAATDCSSAPTCQDIHDIAFASHAGCYVKNGFCRLACTDYLAEFLTVGMELFTLDTAKAVFQVAEGCLQNVTQIIEEGSCMGDGPKGILKSVLRILGEGQSRE